jgi:hypothetical protein
MQAIPAALAALGTSTATAVSVGSAVVGGVAAVGQARYQSQVAKNNATIATQNAERTRFETQVANQQQDQEARADIGALLAQGGASGLALGVGSMGLRRKSAEQLAARDRAYTDYAGETRAAGFDQQASDFSAEAASANRAGIFGAVGAGLDIKSSLVSGASTVNPTTANRITGRSRVRARG